MYRQAVCAGKSRPSPEQQDYNNDQQHEAETTTIVMVWWLIIESTATKQKKQNHQQNNQTHRFTPVGGAAIDHLVDQVYTPKPPTEDLKDSTTDEGLSIENQVRKEWDPKKGGLPIF